MRAKVLKVYREEYADFGPTFASEKLAAQGMKVSAETLRQWLLAEGLWERQRRRDVHRSRRPRRPCFGELIQMDTSLHDWLEGRGAEMVLVAAIDDATSRIEAGFYEGETVEAYMDMTERWLRRHGRPLAFYTDKDSVFQWQSKGRAAAGLTQYGRAMKELDIELILAHSPQADRAFLWHRSGSLGERTAFGKGNDPSGRQRVRVAAVGAGIQSAFCRAADRRRRRASGPGTALLLAGDLERADPSGSDECRHDSLP